MNIYDEMITLADQLTLAEKARLIERLSMTMQQELEVEAFRRMPWHEFVQRTAGSLADDPIKRPAQPPMEVREPLE